MLTFLISSYGVENIEVSSIINNIFQSGGLNKITFGVKALGTLALIIYFTNKLGNVFSGSEQITPKLFGPPLIYAALLLSWTELNSQLDSGLLAIQKEFQTSTPNDSRSTKTYNQIIKKWSLIPSSGTEESSSPINPDQSNSFFNLDKIKEKVTSVVNIMNKPEILVLKISMFGIHILNTVIIVLFNAFSYIWINLLRIGGIVALALYFFPTFKGTFTSWLRNYISVYLWIPIGSLMIYVSDQLFLEIANKVGDINSINIQFMPAPNPDTIMKMTFLVVSALATTILKLILLSKVPSVIGYWLGGGNTGNMFSSAPAMVMTTTNAVNSAMNSVSQVATGSLSGGASAVADSKGGSIANSLNNGGGRSLKG